MKTGKFGTKLMRSIDFRKTLAIFAENKNQWDSNIYVQNAKHNRNRLDEF